MTDPSTPPSLEELGSRIAKARQAQGLEPTAPEPQGGTMNASGLGAGLRISIEIVVALVVSTGLGWVFDQWWGTTPWVMLVMFVLGGAAGINNAIRAANRMDAAAAKQAGQGGNAGPDRNEGAKGGD
ncbi:MAG: AtpZ/AtpI family protein [Alphaproteobacteria bacterium]